jgi:hypothetical protein
LCEEEEEEEGETPKIVDMTGSTSEKSDKDTMECA